MKFFKSHCQSSVSVLIKYVIIHVASLQYLISRLIKLDKTKIKLKKKKTKVKLKWNLK